MPSKGKTCETTEYKLSKSNYPELLLRYSCEQVHLLRLGERLTFFLVVYSTPTSEKAPHSYTQTAREMIGGIHVKRGTAPPLVNSVTRQFSHVSQSIVTGRLVLDCTCTSHLGDHCIYSTYWSTSFNGQNSLKTLAEVMYCIPKLNLLKVL